MLKYLRAVLYFIPYLLIQYPCIIFMRIFKNKFSKISRMRFSKKKINAVCDAFGAKFIVEGKEKYHVPGAALFVCNHQSLFDPFYFIKEANEPTTIIAKKEINKYPIVKHVANIYDCKLIDRKNLRQSLVIINECSEILKKGEKVIVFPEGTRSKDLELQEYKPAAFKMALDSKVDIYPVVIANSYKVFSKKHRIKESVVYVKFLDRIPYEQIKDLTTKEIATMVEEVSKTNYKKIKNIR